jgi:hypothetical protein
MRHGVARQLEPGRADALAVTEYLAECLWPGVTGRRS